MVPTKLSKLLVAEVSGVDDPANELRGWLVAKSRSKWDGEAAEKRVRAATGATEAPTPEYAECFLWNAGDGDELPSDFGAYKFLIADAADDGELTISLEAVRAARASYSAADLSDEDKAAVGELAERLEERLAEEQEPRRSTTSIVGKLKSLLTGKEDIDMTKEELQAELDARFGGLEDKLDALSKAVEVPAPAGEAAPVVEDASTKETDATDDKDEDTSADASEALTKAIETALEPFVEALSKTLDRVAAVEERLSIRKSLDGQEEGEVEKDNKPTLNDAVSAAFRGHAVTLR